MIHLSVASKTCEIRFWKYSGAELFPNDRQIKQNRPNSDMKVVSLDEFW